MVKRVVSVFLSIVMLTSASLVFAGGPPAAPVPPACYPAKPCGPGGPAGAPSAYWGDAPIPGLCGGIIALPFLVCGSLLGGNTADPMGLLRLMVRVRVILRFRTLLSVLLQDLLLVPQLIRRHVLRLTRVRAVPGMVRLRLQEGGSPDLLA